MSHLSCEMNTRESHYPVLFDTFRPNSTSRMESSCKTSAQLRRIRISLSCTSRCSKGEQMEWLDEVRARDKRDNQVLFAKDSAFLEDLRSMIASQSHRVLVLWALGLADESVTQLASRYPNDSRPREAFDAARAWAAGEIKMRQAQQKILACHAVAKDIDNREDIAMCHAVGQA